LIENEKHVTKQFVRAAGEKLILLGGAPEELGGSQFLSAIHGLKTGDAPSVDLSAEKKLQQCVLILIKAGVVRAAHDLSEGGLLVAVSEMLFAPDRTFGAKIDLTSFGTIRSDALLFGESQGRVILSVPAERAGTVLSEAHTNGVAAAAIGDVLAEPELNLLTRRFSAKWSVADLRHGWETSIERAMARPGLE
jgi:phosphoribosylformylglycinamidine synthase